MTKLQRNHQYICAFLLGFMAIAMPNLNLLMSIGTILLLGWWFYNPGPKQGWKNLKQNKLALGLIGLFLLHVLWLANTVNFDYASHDLRIKLPILIFGLVIGSMQFQRWQIKVFFLAMSAGIWFASIQAYINYAGFVQGLHDYREIVQGISHIRLSLLMVVTIAAIFYFWRELSAAWKIYSVLTALNILTFFNVLQSLTGVAALIALIVLSVVYWLVRSKKYMLVGGLTLLSIASAVGFYYFASNYYQTYFTTDEEANPTELYTAEGNEYLHDNRFGIVDNQHYVFTYVAQDEMAAAWNERSDLKVDYSTGENLELAATLTRYLSSKGLRKDKQGVMALTPEDVRNIEIGFPSVLYLEKSGLSLRFHTFMFGIHIYKQTGNASGLSFFQRVVYWSIARKLIAENFWLGTGTGDLRQDFEAMYDIHEPNLEQKYRNRAHNQFMTFFASFGLLGFLYFIGLFVLAFAKRGHNYLALAFYTIAFLSCLVEDTLETQAGVTFFAFFFALFSQPFLDEKATG